MTALDPSTLCADCDKPWRDHFGKECGDGRTWKPAFDHVSYPPNRGTLDADGNPDFGHPDHCSLCAVRAGLPPRNVD